MKGKAGSELDNSAQQRAIYESLAKRALLARAFYYNYSNYCKSQERRTPRFQKFFSAFKVKYSNVEDAPDELRKRFLDGSRPLMKYTNILTFNVRAICIYMTCLLNCPWIYLLIEMTVMNILYVYMRKQHEALCASLSREVL